MLGTILGILSKAVQYKLDFTTIFHYNIREIVTYLFAEIGYLYIILEILLYSNNVFDSNFKFALLIL